MTPTSETIQYVDPALLIGDRNIRFGLLPSRVEALADSIIERGSIETPLVVEPAGEDGSFRIKDGHYRHAAATKLNKEKNAGLLVPVIVRPATDLVNTLKTQLVANLERQDMTPMDKAVAMRDLLEAGVSRADIRNLFRTVGGRKGARNQPLSNSSLNMHVQFLDLPKAIQQKIHEGTIGVAAAYELTKVDADKRTAILEKAEQAYEAQLEKEQREEEKFLSEQAKVEMARQKEKETLDALERQKLALAEADKLVQAKADAAADAYKVTRGGVKDDEEKAKVQAILKEAETDAKKAEQAREKIRKELAKLEEKVQSAEKNAQERAKKLADARKAANKTGKDNRASKGVTPAAVKKAAQDAGATKAVSPLTAKQIKDVVEDWCIPGGNPKAESAFKAIRACFAGQMTSKAAWNAVLTATGEKAAKADKKSVGQ